MVRPLTDKRRRINDPADCDISCWTWHLGPFSTRGNGDKAPNSGEDALEPSESRSVGVTD